MRFPALAYVRGDGFLTELHRLSGVSYKTVWRASKGHGVRSEVADKLVPHLGGECSVEELSYGDPKALEFYESDSDAFSAYLEGCASALRDGSATDA